MKEETKYLDLLTTTLMDVFDEIRFDKIKYEFYCMAVDDFKNGATAEAMQGVLKNYEEMEWYAACAGIKEAIDEFNTK